MDSAGSANMINWSYRSCNSVFYTFNHELEVFEGFISYNCTITLLITMSIT